jgi:rare lipoprotein A
VSRAALPALLLSLIGAGCLEPRPVYTGGGTGPVVAMSGYTQRGEASYYGPGFQGRLTANGETFDTRQLTCAHRTLPFNTILRVRNLANDKTVEVRVNDRGPYVGGRIVDLTEAAAERIDMKKSGVARVELTVISSPD